MTDTIYDRLSGEAKMQIRYGLKDLDGWLRNTIAVCESDSVGQTEKAAWSLRKVIDTMENPVAIANLKSLLAELEGMGESK